MQQRYQSQERGWRSKKWWEGRGSRIKKEKVTQDREKEVFITEQSEIEKDSGSKAVYVCTGTHLIIAGWLLDHCWPAGRLLLWAVFTNSSPAMAVATVPTLFSFSIRTSIRVAFFAIPQHGDAKTAAMPVPWPLSSVFSCWLALRSSIKSCPCRQPWTKEEWQTEYCRGRQGVHQQCMGGRSNVVFFSQSRL